MYIHLMDAPSSIATLSTFPHSVFQYNPSSKKFKYKGVEYIPPTSMSHTCYSLSLYFGCKTPITEFLATGLWEYHIKVILTTWKLYLQGLQPYPKLPDAHQ